MSHSMRNPFEPVVILELNALTWMPAIFNSFARHVLRHFSPTAGSGLHFGMSRMACLSIYCCILGILWNFSNAFVNIKSSKVNFINLLNFALDGIFSSSFAPLTMIFYFLIFFLIGLLIFLYLENLFILTIFLTLICITNILGILVIGYYIKNLHSNEKAIYIISEKINFD